MKEFRWDAFKSHWLKLTRGASFEEVLTGEFVDIKNSTNRLNQKVLVMRYHDDFWAIPFVQAEDHVFLKTLYRSRKYRKIYEERSDHEKG